MYMFSNLFLLENSIICIVKISAQFILFYFMFLLCHEWYFLQYATSALHYENKNHYFSNTTKFIMMFMQLSSDFDSV